MKRMTSISYFNSTASGPMSKDELNKALNISMARDRRFWKESDARCLTIRLIPYFYVDLLGNILDP